MNPKMAILRKRAMALPLLPGVYIMHSADGEIIYIGKAKALRNRVSQYFGSQNNHAEKVRRMVDNVDHFEYIITDSEFEALILECSLIKQHTPKYNILLKDDKGYSYIKVSGDKWRKISYVLQKNDDNAEYIGPYKSSYYVKSAVEEANKIFMLPTCNRKFPQDFGKGRPCLNYHIKLCSAPCTGKVKFADYNESVEQALAFLKGGSSNSVKDLTKKMEEAAENLEFERAARIRDKISSIKKMGDKQKVVANKVLDEDVIGSFSDGKKTCYQVFRFEGGRLFDRESFVFDSGDSDSETEEYIADNNIQLYTINAIDKAIEIGMGKRTNTILQSAFFKLADVMPIEDAVNFMKQAAQKSYGKKGQDVVEMNWKAIDAGVDAIHKVDVPASWSNPEADPAPKELAGRPELVKQIRDVMEPIARMDGDSLPVSAFVANANGEWEQGASAYEKRGTAVNVPEWDAAKCVGCNQCAFVCSHATIRPFQLTADELAAAPAQTKSRDNKPANEYKFVMAVSPLDCMGCGECVTVCPTKAIQMVPQESQADQQAVFDYCVANISKKPSKFADDTVIGSQFNQPLLEFSGSCAGCAETSYARLITQLFGEKMYISNATGCSSIWGGTASISPYTVNKDSGHGPAWCNSLFEDNAEHGLGLYLGQKTVRENLIKRIAEVAGSDKASAELKAAFDEFMATKNNTKANDAPAKALIAELEKAAAAGCAESAEILKSKEFIAKKSVWIFGGDGWAYDIGFGGLDHVLASGEDVNVMVFDTEMYSNTGGQASKASNIGEVCQFAAAGKEISKKSLSEIAMTYGYIYVAQIALGANMNQAVKAIAEAEAYPGPSLIIGYAPCELHGVKGGMTNCQNEMKKAVEAGYWNLFTFNPANKAQGKNPFTLTSKAVDAEKYQALLANETRYSRLTRAFPERAKQLFARNEQVANDRYEHLTRLVELYK